jgi:hypothetical protein
MAKITKPDLARGSFLSSQHIQGALTPVGNLFTNKLDTENLQQIKTPFFVNYHFNGFNYDVMGLTETEQQNGVYGDLVFPIPLIPPQDHFNAQGRLTTDTQTLLLDSISFSIDIRGEGAAMDAPFVAGVPLKEKGWKINYEKAADQDIQFSILQKDYWFLSNTSYTPNSSVFTTTIPASIAFAGTAGAVQNPYYVSGINKQMHPYKMYYLAFHFTNQKSKQFFISNFTISMKFYSILDTRNELYTNTGNKSTQNAENNINTYDLNLLPPASYARIDADGTTGIQTNLNKIDLAVEEKLTTGHNKFGQPQFYDDENDIAGIKNRQAIDTFASYDVIIVPFWAASYGKSGAITTWNGTNSDVMSGPISPNYYGSDSRFIGPIQDIRTIPIFYPFTIHHVLAYHNHQIRNSAGLLYDKFGDGVNGNCYGRVGVGLGTGLQTDKYSYEEIAYWEYDKNFNNTVDRIRIPASTYSIAASTRDLGTLMQVPITYGATSGVGFYSQRAPVYCGGGTKLYQSRSGVPTTLGMENFLEIRWEFQFQSGAATWVETPATGKYGTVMAGFGGNFVYIIGKKMLTTNRNTLKE